MRRAKDCIPSKCVAKVPLSFPTFLIPPKEKNGFGSDHQVRTPRFVPFVAETFEGIIQDRLIVQLDFLLMINFRDTE
jgi:hypothetical protein